MVRRKEMNLDFVYNFPEPPSHLILSHKQSRTIVKPPCNDGIIDRSVNRLRNPGSNGVICLFSILGEGASTVDPMSPKQGGKRGEISTMDTSLHTPQTHIYVYMHIDIPSMFLTVTQNTISSLLRNSSVDLYCSVKLQTATCLVLPNLFQIPQEVLTITNYNFF
jgi:hypothetical protein